AQLAEELESRAIQVELILRGSRLALERSALLGLGADARPEPLDLLFFLPDGRLQLLLFCGTTIGRLRGRRGVPGEQGGLRARHVERAADEAQRRLLVWVGDHAAAVQRPHHDARLAIPGPRAVQRGERLVRRARRGQGRIRLIGGLWPGRRGRRRLRRRVRRRRRRLGARPRRNAREDQGF